MHLKTSLCQVLKQGLSLNVKDCEEYSSRETSNVRAFVLGNNMQARIRRLCSVKCEHQGRLDLFFSGKICSKQMFHTCLLNFAFFERVFLKLKYHAVYLDKTIV